MAKKILHVIDHTGAGGAQVFLFNSISQLKKKYSISVAVLGREGLFSEKIRSMQVPVYSFGACASVWNPFSIIPLIRLIHSGGFQLIHAQLYKSYIIGGLAAILTKRKLLLHDQTGIYPESLRYFCKNRVFRIVYLIMYRYILKHDCHVVALTRYTIEFYRTNYHLRDDLTTVLPNPVDIRQYNSRAIRKTPVDAFRSLPGGTGKIIMIARLAQEKDWPTFLNVAQRVRTKYATPCRFFIVGSGPEENRLRLIVERNRLDHVCFLGYREDIPALLGQADVFLLTSRREPFGNVAIEAMAAGCPVVATHSEGPDSYIRHGVNGFLVDAGDVETMSDIINSLLIDKRFARHISDEAKKDVEANFSIDRLTIRLIDIYNKVLDS